MVEILKAMGTAAALLLPIVILVLIVSIAAVNRGTAAMSGSGHHDVPGAAPLAAETVPSAGKKAAAVVVVDPSVGEILLFGTVLFVVAVLMLLGISLVSHMA